MDEVAPTARALCADGAALSNGIGDFVIGCDAQRSDADYWWSSDATDALTRTSSVNRDRNSFS